MPRFRLVDSSGHDVVLLEAPSRLDAELYGLRHHAADFSHLVNVDAEEAAIESSSLDLAGALERLGMSAESAKTAAAGRQQRTSLPALQVGRQEAGSVGTGSSRGVSVSLSPRPRSGPAKPAPLIETELREPAGGVTGKVLEEAFRRLGMTATSASEAARGHH